MSFYFKLHLIKFARQLIKFIEVYYNFLKEESQKKLSSFDEENNIKWKDEIINLLDSYYSKYDEKNPPNNKKIINIKGFECRKNYIIKELNKNTKEEQVTLDFELLFELVQFLYLMYYKIKVKKNNKKNHRDIEKNMTRCISKELIDLIQYLKIKEDQKLNPPIECVLRFYQNQYYLIQFFQLKKNPIQLNNYCSNQLKVIIHYYMEKNLKSESAYELNPLMEELNKLDEKLNNNKYNEGFCYQNLLKNFQINYDDEKKIESNKEEKKFKEKIIDDEKEENEENNEDETETYYYMEEEDDDENNFSDDDNSDSNMEDEKSQ